MATLVLAPMPRLKPLDDAAELTGVGRRTIQRWLGEGILTAYRIAGDKRRYVDVAEIEKVRKPEALPRREVLLAELLRRLADLEAGRVTDPPAEEAAVWQLVAKLEGFGVRTFDPSTASAIRRASRALGGRIGGKQTRTR